MKKSKKLFLSLFSAMFLMTACGQTDTPVTPGPEQNQSGNNENGGQKDTVTATVAAGNYVNLKMYKDDACTAEITDNKVEKGSNFVITFNLKNGNEEIDAVTVEGADSVAKVSDEGGYKYKVTNATANVTITIATKVKETPVDAHEVTFNLGEHVKDLKVYKTEARAATDVDTGSKYYSRVDTTGEPTKTDGQINFEFKLDAGYQLKAITATKDKYNNIKFLGNKNGVISAKVTKITGDIEVGIEAEADTVAHEGNTVTLVKGDHVTSIKIYTDPGFNVESADQLVTKSIDSTNGQPTKKKGKVYFVAEMEEGYEFDKIELATEDEDIEFDSEEEVANSHVIKKINGDITATVKAKAIGGEVPPEPVATGYDVNFNLVVIEGNQWNGQSHLKNLKVYTDQTLTTEDTGTQVSQGWSTVTNYATRNGDTGEATQTDGQINFRIEADEGYQIKSVTVNAGTYKNIKYIPAKDDVLDSYRITKINANTTVTIEAEAVKEGFPISFEGVGGVKTFTDATFTTEIENDSTLSIDADGANTKTNGSLYFQVEAAHGFKLKDAAPTLAIDDKSSIEKVTVDGKENCYKLTKINHANTVKFVSERDEAVPFLYFKSTTKANTYEADADHIAQKGDTYFVIGDGDTLVAVWFWTYDGDEAREEINIVLKYTLSNGVIDVSFADPIAQYNNEATDRCEWQHVGNKKFAVEEIDAADFPTEFTHYLTLFAAE